MYFPFCGKLIDAEEATLLFPRYDGEFRLLAEADHAVLSHPNPAPSPGGPDLLPRCNAGELTVDWSANSGGGAAEPFIRRLGLVSDALAVFRRLCLAPPRRDQAALALQLEEAFWNYYDGYTLASPVRELIRTQARSNESIVGELEHLRIRMLQAPSYKDACAEHALLRMRFVALGAHGYLSDDSVAVGEFIADYFLMQRAVALDIREAGRLRPAVRSIALELQEREARRELLVMRASQHVLDPVAILAALSNAPLGSADFLTLGDPNRLLVFASERKPADRRLLLAVDEGSS